MQFPHVDWIQHYTPPQHPVFSRPVAPTGCCFWSFLVKLFERIIEVVVLPTLFVHFFGILLWATGNIKCFRSQHAGPLNEAGPVKNHRVSGQLNLCPSCGACKHVALLKSWPRIFHVRVVLPEGAPKTLKITNFTNMRR